MNDEVKLFEDEVVRRLVEVFDAGSEQSGPTGLSGAPAGWDLVFEDLAGEAGAKRLAGEDCASPMGVAMLQRIMVGIGATRDAIGISRYGRRLRPRDGRDHLLDYLQEKLDGLVYLRCEVWDAEHPEDGVVDHHRVDVLRTLYDAELTTLAVAVTQWAGQAIESMRAPAILA